MEHIVKQIKDFNVLTEKLIKITYLKTVYRCPTEAEIAFEDYDYNDDAHHNYHTKKHIKILSVYGNAMCDFSSDEWKTQCFQKDLSNAKIHKRVVDYMKDEIERCGLYQNTYNPEAYDDNHYTLNILSIEELN